MSKRVKFDKSGKYYLFDRILGLNAAWNVVISGRSDGKTTGIIHYSLEEYVKHGVTSVYVRKTEEQMKLQRDELFAPFNLYGWVSDATNEEYNSIVRKGNRYYLANIDPESGSIDASSEHFLTIVTLSSAYKVKGMVFIKPRYLILDEIMEDGGTMTNEWNRLLNIVSTVFRDSNDAKIILLSNTVDSESVYLDEMGIGSLLNIKRGSLTTYDMVDPKSGERYPNIALHYYEGMAGGKDSDTLFSFISNEGRENMIINGEIERPKVITMTYEGLRPDEIKRTMHFLARGVNLKGYIIKDDIGIALLIQRVDSTEEQNITERDFIYQVDVSRNPRTFRNPYKSYGDPFTKTVATLLAQDRVYFTDETAALIFKNFMRRVNEFDLLRQ